MIETVRGPAFIRLTRLLAVVLTAACASLVTAGGEPDDCPEQCGEVLKACLDESANRYHCIDVAERCMKECKNTASSARSSVLTKVDSRGMRRCGDEAKNLAKRAHRAYSPGKHPS